jgi:hypothetical protein
MHTKPHWDRKAKVLHYVLGKPSSPPAGLRGSAGIPLGLGSTASGGMSVNTQTETLGRIYIDQRKYLQVSVSSNEEHQQDLLPPQNLRYRIRDDRIELMKQPLYFSILELQVNKA